MSSLYQIIVLKEQRVYSTSCVIRAAAADAFVRTCRSYVDPRVVPEKDTLFNSDVNYMVYSDLSGGDKPAIVIMFGLSEYDIFAEIKEGLRNLYITDSAMCQ